MADKSKTRMNLAAIKKVDPYAKDIVDTSSHVAFYIFDSEQNEWEKTDVEGAFFIYSRNAQPYHSIFINNRLNTTSFVEPITTHLELQAQPPFLLYRNERSRIRGFWFYNSLECDRISKLVGELVISSGSSTGIESSENGGQQVLSDQKDTNNVNIFKMLSNAQQEYNSNQNQRKHGLPAITSVPVTQAQLIPAGNVLKFFESAKPTAEVAFTPRILPNTLSVEQLEKQQRDIQPPKQNIHCEAPQDEAKINFCQNNNGSPINRLSYSALENTSSFQGATFTVNAKPTALTVQDLGFKQDPNTVNCSSSANLPGEQISLSKIFSNINLKKHDTQVIEPAAVKPALMPPTMFDKPTIAVPTLPVNASREPLNKPQFIQAFSYMLQSDDDFVEKLHVAYLKTVNKLNTFQ